MADVRNPIDLVVGALVLAMAALNLRADSTWVYAVQITVKAQTSPPQIILNWVPDQYGANSYTVFRKTKDATSWGTGTTLPGSASSYVDNNVVVGSAYEYQIIKAGSLGYTGHGYIYAGVSASLVDNRGTVVLVVDNTYSTQLSSELAQLQSDLTGDGWTVVRRDVSRNDTPANVRLAIQAVYNSDPANVKAVFLFGHVAILRSGNLNVDGHQARPMPADGYYGDMDGSWNNQSFLPSDVDLMVGRVDLSNLPGNGAATPWPSELELLRNYLNKDHKWRHKLLSVPRKALLGNRFGDFGGEAFAASGFRNLTPFVGADNIDLASEQDSAPVEQKWSSMLQAGTYLWAYGCGGGSYTSMSGMGTHGTYHDVWSTDIVGGDAKAVFFMMFGSWLGEWDSTDNLMRSALATSTMGLTCSWAGRPHWYYHHMGLGEPIGYSARVTQNNGGLYQNQVNQNLRGIHIALMGDPTVRMHPVAPPSSLVATPVEASVSLTWTASPEANQGYHVYRAASASGPFTRLTSSPMNGTSFTDPSSSVGEAIYMVRAIKLEETPSGTYFNASQGTFSNGGTSGTPAPVVTLTAPVSGATVTGTVTVAASVLNIATVAGVQFKLDGADLGTEASLAPYNVPWNTIQTADGTHQLSVTARDSAGALTASPEMTIIVNNSGGADLTPPSVAITAPTNNAHISGATVTVAANAADETGVAGVQFKIDGGDLGAELTTAPFNANLDATMLNAGTHSLLAIARDAAGNRTTSSVVTVFVGNVTFPPASNNNDIVWFEDTLPANAIPSADGGDGWTWVTANPAPFSGTTAHQSNSSPTNHQHFFNYASPPMPVNTGDVLVAYVYLDPTDPPSEIMLQWNNGSWEHRAYWGTSLNTYGVDGTASRRPMGPLPATGQWVRLEVPANSVGLEGSNVKGMAFSLFGGRATWDHVGKRSSAVAAATRVPQGIAITWPTQVGQFYRVLYTTNLMSTNWNELSGPINAIDSVTTWTDTNTQSDQRRFYKIAQ